MFNIFVIVLSIVCYIVAEDADANKLRIFGGSLATENQFAYQVSLRYNGTHLCGGTIVDTSWILTAAHCAFGRSEELISFQVASNNLTTGGIEYFIDRVIIHENWQLLALVNDLAMIHLIRPIILIENRAAIGILTRRPVPDGAVLTVAGWGLTVITGTYSEQLNVIRQIKINQTECRRRGIPAQPTNMCILSVSGRGICEGDSGSPCSYNNRIVGVAAYALPCATGLPDVFTDLTQYVDWVQNIIRRNLSIQLK